MIRPYVQNLDALRALAVLLVMAFHARYLAFGWIGVFIFFALSGFLITRSLVPLCRMRLGQGLATFYLRRTLRIWPAYYLYLGAILVALGAGLLAAAWWRPFGLSVVYLYNLSPLLDVSGGRVFSHLWSLAVEEQYYLAAAPVVLLLGPARAGRLFAGGLVAVPCLRGLAFPALEAWLGAARAGEAVQMLTPFQLDGFMAGGLLALHEERVRAMSRVRFALVFGTPAGLAVAALAANAALLAAQGAFTSGGAALDFSGIARWRLSPTSLGIAVGARENGAHIWLYSALAALSVTAIAVILRAMQEVRLPLANAIGRVSYGMYLYHSVLVSGLDRAVQRLGIVKHSAAGWAALLVLVLVTWAVALLSYRVIEQPFLRLKRGGRWRRPRRFARQSGADQETANER